MVVMMGGNKFVTRRRKGNWVIMILMSVMISGCSTYGSSFGCGDSKGAICMPMDKVDRLIKNGEIERYTKVGNAKCRGRNCSLKNDSKILQEDALPSIASEEINLKTIEN